MEYVSLNGLHSSPLPTYTNYTWHTSIDSPSILSCPYDSKISCYTDSLYRVLLIIDSFLNINLPKNYCKRINYFTLDYTVLINKIKYRHAGTYLKMSYNISNKKFKLYILITHIFLSVVKNYEIR